MFSSPHIYQGRRHNECKRNNHQQLPRVQKAKSQQYCQRKRKMAKNIAASKTKNKTGKNKQMKQPAEHEFPKVTPTPTTT